MLEGKYLFWRLEALMRKTYSRLELISDTFGLSCRSFLAKRIFHSSDFETSSLEQRANIKFCVLIEKSTSESLDMLKKEYRNDVMYKNSKYMSAISVFVKFAQTLKITLGLRTLTKTEKKWCYRCFSITRVLFTTKLFLKAKLSIKNFT